MVYGDDGIKPLALKDDCEACKDDELVMNSAEVPIMDVGIGEKSEAEEDRECVDLMLFENDEIELLVMNDDRDVSEADDLIRGSVVEFTMDIGTDETCEADENMDVEELEAVDGLLDVAETATLVDSDEGNIEDIELWLKEVRALDDELVGDPVVTNELDVDDSIAELEDRLEEGGESAERVLVGEGSVGCEELVLIAWEWKSLESMSV